MVRQRWRETEGKLVMRILEQDSAVEIRPGKGDGSVPKWAPNGQTIAAWGHDHGLGAVFMLRRDAHSAWTKFWQLENGQLPVWSAHGSTLAYVRYDGSLATIAADSSATHEVYAPCMGGLDSIASSLVWSLEPRTLWFIGSNREGHGGIWSVPVAGGAPVLVVSFDDAAGRTHGASIATDGSLFHARRTVQQ